MSRTTLLLLGCLLALPLLAGLALLWRRRYRDEGNQARRLLKNSAVPLGLRLLVKGLDLVVALLVLSTIAPAALGAYDLAALFVVQYLGTLSEFGLGLLLTREAAREPAAARRLFGATLLLRLLLCVACVPVAALLIGGYALLGAPLSLVGQQAIWVLLLTLLPGAYSGAATSLYQAAEQMEVPAFLELLTAIVSTVARITVVLLGWGVLGLAWAAVAVSCATALAFGVLQTRSFFAPRLAWDASLLRGLARQSFPLMLNGLLLAVFFRFDAFLVRAFAGGDDAVALYTMPYRVLSIAMVLPPAIVGAVFPLLARRAAGERAALAQAERVTLQALLLLAVPLATGMSLLAPQLVAFFTRDNAPFYLTISPVVLAVTAWFLPLSFVNGLSQYLLIALGRQGRITLAFGLSAAFNFGLNLLLIPLAGAWGLRSSLVAASVVTILTEGVLYGVLRRELRPEGLSPPLGPLLWRPAGAALAMGLVLLPLRWLPLLPGLALLLAAVGGPLAYGAALWLLGAFGHEERALVRRVLGRV